MTNGAVSHTWEEGRAAISSPLSLLTMCVEGLVSVTVFVFGSIFQVTRESSEHTYKSLSSQRGHVLGREAKEQELHSFRLDVVRLMLLRRE